MPPRPSSRADSASYGPPIPRALLLLLSLALLTGCSSDSDATAPVDEDDPLRALAGRWEATSMVLTSKNDPNESADIIQNPRFSGSFVLTIQQDGRYTATITVFEMEQVERGNLSVSGDTLIFDPDGGPTSRVAWELSGDALTLDGESEFDFNDSGEDEPATLHLELVRG